MKQDPYVPTQPEQPQPVAYDAEGRPLYAHPPVQQPAVVHVARPLEPEKQVMSAERQRLHDRSKRLYPLLNLSEGEYVIQAVRRHPIGLILPLAAGTIAIGLLLSLLFNYDLVVARFTITGVLSSAAAIAVPVLVLVAIIGLGMFIAYYVYVNNKFFLTNESVIQELQISLFSRQEQTVSLANMEDASYTQHGILQQILD